MYIGHLSGEEPCQHCPSGRLDQVPCKETIILVQAIINGGVGTYIFKSRTALHLEANRAKFEILYMKIYKNNTS